MSKLDGRINVYRVIRALSGEELIISLSSTSNSLAAYLAVLPVAKQILALAGII